MANWIFNTDKTKLVNLEKADIIFLNGKDMKQIVAQYGGTGHIIAEYSSAKQAEEALIKLKDRLI